MFGRKDNITFTGRQEQCAVLRKCELSGNAELLVVYGRFRAGKTTLINHYFSKMFTFAVTGISIGKMQDQLSIFHSAMNRYFRLDAGQPAADWFKSFGLLAQCLKENTAPGRKVLFFDEASWLDTPKSSFLPAFEHFWNSFASRRDDILLILCSSAGPWVKGKLTGNYCNLHGKITQTMYIEPLSLMQCEKYFKGKAFKMNKRQVIEAYMILGGIPFYFDAFDSSLELSQNVDLNLFGQFPSLGGEFDRLYHLFFRVPDNNVRVAKALSLNMEGMTRAEIAGASGVSEGGGLTKILGDMESCGLIECAVDYRRKKGSGIYKLVDLFTYFYFEFMEENSGKEPKFWSKYTNGRERSNHPIHKFMANAFERVCTRHIPQIKRKLGVSGMQTEDLFFRSTGESGDAETGSTWSGYTKRAKDPIQPKSGNNANDAARPTISIVIDRPDGVVDLCHCRYRAAPYVLTQRDIDDFEQKRSLFINETGTAKKVRTILISSNEFTMNAGSSEIDEEIILDDLFA